VAIVENRIGLRPITHLARIVFGIPATSAPSEREFSSVNFIATALRSGLDPDPDTVIKLANIRSHLRNVGAKEKEFLAFAVRSSAQQK
jgi:hypothetical protein